jgi:WD40 repeat protein
MPAPEIVLQIGHGSDIYALAFAPDCRTLAAAGSERTVRLWDAITGDLRMLLPQGQACRALTFSPNGALLACAGEGEVNLWEPQTGKHKATLTGHCGIVSALAFSPDGKVLACANEGQWFGHEFMWVKGGEVQLWDVPEARLKQALGKSRTEKLALAWSPDGKLLAVASSDNVVRLWDPPAGESRRNVLRHRELRTVAFSPDGQVLATGGAGGTKLWDLHTLKPRKSLPAAEVSSVAFTPGGDELAAGSQSSVVLYDAASGKRAAVLETTRSNSGVSDLALSPDGSTLARGSNTFLRPSNIKLWDVGRRKLTRVIAGSEASEVSAVAFSPDGRSLFSAGGIFEQAGDVTQWDAETGALKQVLIQHGDDISHLARSSNGNLLVARVGARLLCWDARTGKKLPRAVVVTDAFALSANGGSIAAADKHSGIRLLDTMTSQVQRTFKQQANVLAISPDGQTLAAGSERGLSLWDIDAAARKWRTEKLRIDVTQLAFSSDGCLVAAHTIQWKGSKGRDEVRVWDVASGEQVHVIGVDDWPFSVLFSPDSAVLVVAAGFEADTRGPAEAQSGSAVQVWDTQSWRLKHRLLCDSEEVKNVTFSPDGKLLVATHANRTATLWNLKRGTRFHVLEDAAGELTCLAFSPDGKKLATGNHDGWICFWEVSTARPLATLQVLPAEVPRGCKKEWIAFTPAGYYNASARGAKFIRWREGDRLLPAKAFASRFRRPDLVAKALRVR